MKNIDLNFVIRVMKIFNGFAGPSASELWWRTDGEYAPLTLFANCNDLFYWAVADCEEITEENIEILESCARELEALSPTGDYHHAHLLFCCRIHKMRPQGAYYKYIEIPQQPLFNACGPEREVQFGNPLAPGEDEAEKISTIEIKPQEVLK